MATNRPNPPKGATNIKNIQIAEPTGFLPGFTFLGPGKGASAAIGDYLEEKLPDLKNYSFVIQLFILTQAQMYSLIL